MELNEHKLIKYMSSSIRVVFKKKFVWNLYGLQYFEPWNDIGRLHYKDLTTSTRHENLD